MTFLSDLAHYIIKNKEVDLIDTAIILPNKRSKRLLLQSISKEVYSPFFSPALFDINEFIEKLSTLKKISNSELLIQLYKSYLNLKMERESPFFSFLSWGTLFLKDINDIDMQLADPKVIFQNLKDIKEMETSFGKEQLTENQKNYLRFYAVLGDLYHQFSMILKADKVGYEGSIYKEVALNIDMLAGKHSYKRFIFAGLSVLSPSEIKIIRFFKENFPCEFFFDFDTFYLDALPNIHEQLKEKLALPAINYIRDDYATIPKTISQSGVSGKMNQIVCAIDKLRNIKKSQGNLDNTVLVLADESLLVPFINVFKDTDVNYTMGYPLTALPMYDLLIILLRIAENSFRFKEIEKKRENTYYCKDILAFYQHPVIQNRFSSTQEHTHFISTLINQNKSFFTLQELPNTPPGITLTDLFSENGSLLQNLISLFENLLFGFAPDDPFFSDTELIIDALTEVNTVLNQIDDKIIQIDDIRTIEYLIREKISGMTIPFQGEPEKGLQVMGLLETRGLDFKNVIILSTNEGVLPMGRSQNSLLLFDLRRHFNLPDHRHKDSVAAYHFFRLLQRAEDILLIYNTHSTDNTLVEKSRFINQLEYEVKNQHLEGHIKLKEEQFSILPQKREQENALLIHKTPEILDKLYAKEYSPTTLSSYIHCPIQFYLSAIEKIEITETIQERVEQRVIGTITHQLLEDIFKKVKENPSEKITIIQDELTKLSGNIKLAFSENEKTKGVDFSTGRGFLTMQIVRLNLGAYLNYTIKEFSENEIEVLDVEKKMTATITISGKTIHLKGCADRIDLRNGDVIIFDYKTGRVEVADLKYDEMASVVKNRELSKLFQLLMYGFLYRNMNDNQSFSQRKMSCGIISFAKINLKGDKFVFMPQFQDENFNKTEYLSSSLIEEFEKELHILLENILNPDIPFCQTENIDHCKYCDYITLCSRE